MEDLYCPSLSRNYIVLYYSEGIPLRQGNQLVKKVLHQLDNFPTYLLGVCSVMISKTLATAFESMAPPGRATLFWLFQLQRCDIIFQNILATEQGAVASKLLEAMQYNLFDYKNFLFFKRSNSIALCLWERALQ